MRSARSPNKPAARTPIAWIITAAVGHTIEHGAQIRQFITVVPELPGSRST